MMLEVVRRRKWKEISKLEKSNQVKTRLGKERDNKAISMALVLQLMLIKLNNDTQKKEEQEDEERQ